MQRLIRSTESTFVKDTLSLCVNAAANSVGVLIHRTFNIFCPQLWLSDSLKLILQFMAHFGKQSAVKQTLCDEAARNAHLIGCNNPLLSFCHSGEKKRGHIFAEQ